MIRLPREETGSLQVANPMRLVLLNVSLYILVIQVSTRDSIPALGDMHSPCYAMMSSGVTAASKRINQANLQLPNMRDSVYEVESPVQYRRTLIYKQTIYQLYKFLRFEATLAFEDIIAASVNIFRGLAILKIKNLYRNWAKPL